jgi:hypothetical protein
MSTIVVSSPTTRVITSSKSQQPANILLKKLDTNIKLQQISNINTTNLTDGFGLVYDAETNEFVFSALTAVVGNVDGGTY